MAMIKPTEEELEYWKEMARRIDENFVAESGEMNPGRLVIAKINLEIMLVTPVPAAPYDEELNPKTPPILFDRTATGEILIPGVFLASLFEKMAEWAPDSEVRQAAQIASRRIHSGDIVLPADFDTIEITCLDASGAMVPTEALPPGIRLAFPIDSR